MANMDDESYLEDDLSDSTGEVTAMEQNIIQAMFKDSLVVIEHLVKVDAEDDDMANMDDESYLEDDLSDNTGEITAIEQNIILSMLKASLMENETRPKEVVINNSAEINL